MKRKTWNKKFCNELLKPVLWIGLSPLLICFIMGLFLINTNPKATMGILLASAMWCMFVVTIGLGAGGFDFINRYGMYPNK